MGQSRLESLGNTPLETPAAPPCPSPQVPRLRSLPSFPLSLCDIRILLFYSLEPSKRCDTTIVQRARVLQSPSYKLPLLCFYLLFNRIFHQSKYHFHSVDTSYQPLTRDDFSVGCHYAWNTRCFLNGCFCSFHFISLCRWKLDRVWVRVFISALRSSSYDAYDTNIL